MQRLEQSLPLEKAKIITAGGYEVASAEVVFTGLPKGTTSEIYAVKRRSKASINFPLTAVSLVVHNPANSTEPHDVAKLLEEIEERSLMRGEVQSLTVTNALLKAAQMFGVNLQ